MKGNAMQNEIINRFLSDVERDLLFYIIIHLREEKLTIGQAKDLAKNFLDLLPIANKEELLNKLKILGETYKEAKEVYVKYINMYLEEKEKKQLSLIRMYMKQEDYEKALMVAKGEQIWNQ